MQDESKMEGGCGMTDIFTAGCWIKILRRKRNLFILRGGMRDSFKIDGGMRDKKTRKLHVTNINFAENCDSYQPGSR